MWQHWQQPLIARHLQRPLLLGMLGRPPCSLSSLRASCLSLLCCCLLLGRQHAADGGDLADFSRLVSVLAAEEDAWKQMYGPDGRPDKEMFQAKRPLMHEWITEGG